MRITTWSSPVTSPGAAGGGVGSGASRSIRNTRTPWVAAVAARVRRQRRRAPVARSTLSRGGDRLRIEAEPGEPAVRALDVVHREGQAREPFALGVEDGAQAIRAGAVARGRDQLRRDVGELEDRGLGPAAGRLRAPARGAAQQALVGGDPGVEVAHCDDHVIERRDHATAMSREARVAGTVSEV